MKKKITLVIFALFLFSFAVPAQTDLSGTWQTNQNDWQKYKNKKKNIDGDDKDFNNQTDDDAQEKIQLSFRFENSKGKNNSYGSGFAFEDLQGLTKAQTEAANSAVNFRLAREAGTIEMRGTFQNGKGAGTFTFTPDQNFAQAMQNRGFAFDNEKLFPQRLWI